ncbi:MAG TPA: hypothetical protein VMM55_04460 [Thermohalobaculum sp.]|nr:hypothetical protein [Thermohalobaculum sp.]
MAGDLPVTVVVPTRNEERHLGDCLSRLGAFGRVVVVDSESSDARDRPHPRRGRRPLPLGRAVSEEAELEAPQSRGRAGFHHAFCKLWYFVTVRLIAQELAAGQHRPSPPRSGEAQESPTAERAPAGAPDGAPRTGP